MPPIASARLKQEWMKPENASVFDPAYVTYARWVADTLGLDNPDQIMSIAQPTMVPLNPLMTLVPRVPAAELLERLAPKTAPANVRAAAEYLIKRYPRLMSHVESILPYTAESSTTATASMKPVYAAKTPYLARATPDFPPVREPIAQISFHPERIAGNELESLAHEVTHVAQAVRQTDLAKRVVGEPAFLDLYRRMSAAQGYVNNPLEVAARRTANEVVAKQGSKYAPRFIAKQIWEATGDEAVVKQRLTRLFPKLALDTIESAVNYVRTLPR